MIFVRDKGRLCNNILQYGHVYAWGREHGRKTMSMRFAYKYRHFRICHTYPHNLLTYLFAKYGAKCGWLPVVSFDDDKGVSLENEQMLYRHRNIVAQGWYARWYDLFLKYKGEIIDLFAFDEDVKKSPDKLLETFSPTDVLLGIHIRRGDYKTWHDGRYYFSDGQYIEKISQFLRWHKDRKVQVIICGNDPRLDEEAYRKALPYCSLHFPKGTPFEDLYMFSQCNFLMGPPSTFTLVASMYRDLPLCWIEPGEQLTNNSFKYFDELFQKIK